MVRERGHETRYYAKDTCIINKTVYMFICCSCIHGIDLKIPRFKHLLTTTKHAMRTWHPLRGETV